MALTGPDAVVVGAGVIGPTTAVCLAEAGRRVAVVAAEPPERTTSIAAGAMVGPVFVAQSDPGGPREHDTFDEFVRLAIVPTQSAGPSPTQSSDLDAGGDFVATAH